MSHRIATATLSSVSPYSASRAHFTPKLDKELADDYEQRTWRNKLHTDHKSGRVVLPAMAFKWALAAAAKRLQLQIAGKGKSTYTKHFLSGVLVMENLPLPIKPDDVPSTPVYCNADGVRGSGKRVMRYFPTIHEWTGDVQFHVIDDVLKPEIFESVLTEAGNFIGIGQFRPENGGYCGRFKVDKVVWN